VKVFDGHALTGADVLEDRVVLEVDGLGAVAARYAIGADGMWSPLRKLVGESAEAGYLGEWHAFRQYFRDVSPEAAAQLWVWFEPDLLPGYAWSFPLPGGRANVGYGILREGGRPTRSMKAQWLDVLARPHIAGLLGPAAAPESPHKAWPIPARIGSTVLSAGGGRVLFAGDAARATDPMTGEGIGQALETGVEAAEAVLGAGWTRPAVAAASYEAVVQRTLAVDHRLAAALSSVLRSPVGARGSVRIAGLSSWTRGNFGRWLFEDYPRAVVATPGRWHRGVFTGPGAYRSGPS